MLLRDSKIAGQQTNLSTILLGFFILSYFAREEMQEEEFGKHELQDSAKLSLIYTLCWWKLSN